MLESNSVWQNLNKSAGWVAIILLTYSLATMAILLVLGPPPTNAQYTLEMLKQNQLVGLLRLDVLTTLVMPLYYLLFFSLFIDLRKSNELGAMITLLLGCAGLTLFLAAPSFVSWMALSKRFTIATTETQKTYLLAAGETILALDLWHSSSGFVGGATHANKHGINIIRNASLKQLFQMDCLDRAANAHPRPRTCLADVDPPLLWCDLDGDRRYPLPGLVSTAGARLS